MDGNAAARGEFAEHFNIFRVYQFDEVFYDDVDAIFVKVAVVAEAEEVEFERFALHHFDIGDIADEDGGEIGLAGERAQAGEFRANEFDEVVVAGVFVVEGFEDFGGVGGGILRTGVAQQGKAAELFFVAHGNP